MALGLSEREAALSCEGPTTYATFNTSIEIDQDRGAVLASARWVREQAYIGGVAGGCTSDEYALPFGDAASVSKWRIFDPSNLIDLPVLPLNGGRPF